MPCQPPHAEPRPETTLLHGEARVDEYAWMAERDSPDVAAYLAAEHAYAVAVMAPTAALQAQLYREMVDRLPTSDVFVPYEHGPYLYWYRSEKVRQYPIYCRRAIAGGPDEVYFDPNTVVASEGAFELGAFSLSPDHGLLAFSYDPTGDESFTLAILDIARQELLPWRVTGTYGDVAWGADSRSLVYVALDAVGRPAEARHRVFDGAVDTPVFTERDGAFHVSVSTSKSGAYVFVRTESLSCSETWFAPASDPAAGLACVERREPAVEYDVDDAGDRFVVVARDDLTSEPSLFECDHDAPNRSSWRAVDLGAAADGLHVETVDPFRDYYAVLGRCEGVDSIVVVDRRSGATHAVPVPGGARTINPLPNPEYSSRVLLFLATSLVMPPTVCGYDMATRALEVRKRADVPGYEPARYGVERLAAESADGTRVPVTIAYRNDTMASDGANPCLLEGYAAYGEILDTDFAPERIALLDRGWVLAFAHCRGGGELGPAWHTAARGVDKRVSISDFMACAEHLIASRFTSADRLAVTGASAGGLLVAACANQHPDRFAAVVAEVPFVDPITTLLDASLPGTEAERDEWGDPNDPLDYAALRSYAPYDGVVPQAYPAMLILGAVSDTRVPYWEYLKWVARLRARKTDDRPLLLWVDPGGHQGESGRLEYLRRQALVDAFLIEVAGLGHS